ncbi:MAG: transcription initiation factor IIB family protein [Desulfurococcales archaeon]|nr:transcription initiation factor IIB family protein [Desulfurococcales archaeon]
MALGDCRSGIVLTEEGRLVCRDTGEVLSETSIIEGPEWRSFRDQGSVKGLERAGGPITHTQHDLGVSVTLRRPGRIIGSRAHRVSTKIRSARVLKKERHLVSALDKINKACDFLGFPPMAKETAAMIVRMYAERASISNEKERLSIVGAAIAKSIEIHNLPISIGDVLDFLGIGFDDLWSAKRKLSETGVIEVLKVSLLSRSPGGGSERLLRRVDTYIKKIVSELDLPLQVYRLAYHFVSAVLSSGKNLYGKRPETVAAAAVYLASRIYGYDNVNQRVLAETVNIKESNVRKLYRYLIDDMVVIVTI